MVPPLAMALSSTILGKNLYSKEEREAGKSAWVLGLSFISEGAIPFAAADPLRVLASVTVWFSDYRCVVHDLPMWHRSASWRILCVLDSGSSRKCSVIYLSISNRDHHQRLLVTAVKVFSQKKQAAKE